jgi:hypothetical protein
VVNGAGFKKMTAAEQEVFLKKEIMPKIRAAAMEFAKQEDPKIMLAVKTHKMFTAAERRMLKERGVDIEAKIEQLSK